MMRYGKSHFSFMIKMELFLINCCTWLSHYNLRFLKYGSYFKLNHGNSTLKFFEQVGLDLVNIRGQSYDNASNISGCYNGMQAQISSINHLAHYIPCAAHSLHLVGVESCIGAVSFFALVQNFTISFLVQLTVSQ